MRERERGVFPKRRKRKKKGKLFNNDSFVAAQLFRMHTLLLSLCSSPVDIDRSQESWVKRGIKEEKPFFGWGRKGVGITDYSRRLRHVFGAKKGENGFGNGDQRRQTDFCRGEMNRYYWPELRSDKIEMSAN